MNDKPIIFMQPILVPGKNTNDAQAPKVDMTARIQEIANTYKKDDLLKFAELGGITIEDPENVMTTKAIIAEKLLLGGAEIDPALLK